MAHLLRNNRYAQLLALALALFCILAVSACGGANASSSNSNGTTSTANTTASAATIKIDSITESQDQKSATAKVTVTGTIAQVVYLYSGNPLYTAKSAPWDGTLDLSQIPAGTYSIIAQAQDRSGNVLANSAAFSFTVTKNAATTNSITITPLTKSSYAQSDSLMLSVTVTVSAPSVVAEVDYTAAGQPLSSSTTAPSYQATVALTNVPPGSYTIVATALDSTKTVLATSAPVTITVTAVSVSSTPTAQPTANTTGGKPYPATAASAATEFGGTGAEWTKIGVNGWHYAGTVSGVLSFTVPQGCLVDTPSGRASAGQMISSGVLTIYWIG